MSGIERDITNNNDFERVHNESFPFYEYDTKIIPVNVLNGPKNPLLTSNIQRGILKNSTNTITPVETGDQNSTFVVPKNTKWNLKWVQFQSLSLIGTVGFLKLQILNPSNVVIIDLFLDTSGTARRTDNLGSADITLSEDYSIRMTTNLNAYTSGKILHNLIYQEFKEAQ